AAEIHGGNIVVFGQQRRDEVEPVRMCAIAMHEKEAWACRIIITPAQIVNIRAIHIERAALIRCGKRLTEPERAMQDDVFIRQCGRRFFFEGPDHGPACRVHLGILLVLEGKSVGGHRCVQRRARCGSFAQSRDGRFLALKELCDAPQVFCSHCSSRCSTVFASTICSFESRMMMDVPPCSFVRFSNSPPYCRERLSMIIEPRPERLLESSDGSSPIPSSSTTMQGM